VKELPSVITSQVLCHAIKTYGEVVVKPNAFLTSALDAGE